MPGTPCADERLQNLQRLFWEKLKSFAQDFYLPLIKKGIVNEHEINDELELYFNKRRSSLQTVYSYFSEQWDAYYQLTDADNGQFRSLLMRLEHTFARKYDLSVLDIRYYTNCFNQLPFGEAEWLRLRRYFEEKWYHLLTQKEQAYQEEHIGRLIDEYARMIRKTGEETLNTGKPGAQHATRLAWLQSRQCPELKSKMNDLIPILTRSPFIAEINRVLGRKSPVNQVRTRIKPGGSVRTFVHQSNFSDIVGVSTGNDLNRLMPLEYCLMADRDLESVFLKKYVERSLQLFDATGKRQEMVNTRTKTGIEALCPDGMGPFIVCIDTSGSMAGPYELMAKSIVLAIALLAEKSRRSCRVILFSDQCESIEFKQLSAGLPLLKDFLCRSFQGGTDLLPAMQRVLGGLSTDDFRQADLLLLSDFEMGHPDALLQNQFNTLKSKGTSVYAVVFGHSYQTEFLSYFDRYWPCRIADEV